MANYSRREFIKTISGVIGGAMLVSCGSGSGRSPNAYRFYRVATSGDTVGDSARSMVINSFRGSVHLSSNGVITFDAFDVDKRLGVFQVGVDLAKSQPTIDWGRTALIAGETLADGRVVSGVKAMDVNSAGSIAVDIVPTTRKGQSIKHVGSGLYLEIERHGFEPVFNYNQKLLDATVYSTGILGDIALHEDNEILVVASYNAADAEILPGQGLFYLPGASVSSASMLMSTANFVPSANHSLAAIGLVDLHDNGHYVIQGNALPMTSSKANVSGSDVQSSALMLTGNVKTTEKQLSGAAPELGAGDVTGQFFYGPRMTSSGIPYGITWDAANENMKLYHGERLVIGTGDISPTGGEVLLLSTGSVGIDGALYYTISSVNPSSQDLVVYNGVDHSILLSIGDVLADGGAPVEAIYFGATTKHVDAQNRIVMFCSFTDGTGSLVIGLPV